MTSARNPTMHNANRLKLGIFAANCSSGNAVTKAKERWSASWEENERLARLADEIGIEFLLPIARWRGYGGETDFEGSTWETISWAAGLLAVTEKLTVFGTVHAPLVHPIFAAKQFVTVDHMSQGRFGLNIVCGWNQDEFDMFGIEQREHDIRYDYGQEWWDVVRRLWTESEPFDYAGRFLALKDVKGEPKPYGGARPIVMNAGSSGAGRAFAARNCDMLFTSLLDFDRARKDVAEIKAEARSYGREVQVFTSTHVVCRPTRKEAEEYYHYYAVENVDEEAVERLMTLQGLYARSYPPETIRANKVRFAGGHGSYPSVGDPDHVAANLARIAEAGFAGSTIAFMNYLDSLPYFAAEVLPRLERLGVREKR